MQNDDNKILNAKEIQDLLKVKIGIKKIYDLLRSGKIPSKRVGKSFVAQKDDVIDFFKNYYISNTQEEKYAN